MKQTIIIYCILLSIGLISCKNEGQKYIPSTNAFTSDAEYIDPKTALLSKGFEVCNEQYILQYYNPERATYSGGKYALRKFIMDNYENRNYTDSGYLNIRFIINCKGKAGRYVIHENDLDLQPKPFTKDLKEQLFNLTTQLKDWNPNFIVDQNGDAYYDSYMYISYRIEHGNITEILP